jgi:lycopene beta-cyclase
VLPFSDDTLLIEDTRYSDGPELPCNAMREEIERYAMGWGWDVTEILREETGVLPVVLGGDIEQFWAANPDVPRSGVRAGLFNQTTGYSLPEAIGCADIIAGQADLRSETLYPLIRRRSEALWRRSGFLRMLNRMLFLAGEPGQRYRVLQHFYRLPESTVSRFYAGRPNLADRFRILSGRPPVPVAPALRAILTSKASNAS